MEEKDEFWLEENYITNVDEIIELAEQEINSFSSREKDQVYAFVNSKHGPSKLHSLLHRNMSDKLKAAILKTIRPEELEIPPDDLQINRYGPGSFLARHIDAAGKFWKFQLVFLRSDKPHLKVYSSKYPDGKLIEEKPGALFHMPLHLEHEVTLIEENEKPKYSLIIAWSI